MARKRSSENASEEGRRSTKKPRFSFRDKLVHITVGAGSKAEKISVPRDLFIEHSDWARAAFSGRRIESETKDAKLEDQDPAIFDIFTSFLCSGNIHSAGDNDVNRAGTHDKEFERLGLCWALGDSLQSRSFTDAVLDALIEKMMLSNQQPSRLWTLAYEYPQNAAFKKLMVDLAAFAWNDESFQDTVTDSGRSGHAEFMRDVCLRLKRQTPGEQKPWIDCGCKYHDHGEEKPCYKTMF